MSDTFGSVFGTGRTGSAFGHPDNQLDHIVRDNGEEWSRRPGGPFHRAGGPAFVLTEDGMTRTEYYRDGELHRTDGPAVTVSDWRDRVVQEGWYVGGAPHRNDGPAQVIDHANGSRLTEYWVEGERHRVGGPAQIVEKGGEVTCECWYLNGKLHRDDGPALTRGLVSSGSFDQQWAIDGEFHRDVHPACVEWRDGRLHNASWYQHGEHLLEVEEDYVQIPGSDAVKDDESSDAETSVGVRPRCLMRTIATALRASARLAAGRYRWPG